MSELPPNVRELLLAAQTFLHGSTDPKAAIRRAARTSAWKHDDERVAAAEAKRARKQAKLATPDRESAAP